MAVSTRQSSRADAPVKSAVVNLRQLFGRQHKVEYDPAFAAEYGANARVDDPWLQIIPGRHGHIYPHGDNLLAATTNSRGPIANRLCAMPSAQVWQDGDDGVTILFAVEQFKIVAKLLRLRGRRTLTDAAREKLVAAGAASRFRVPAGETD